MLIHCVDYLLNRIGQESEKLQMPIRTSPVNGILEAIFFCLQFGLENLTGFQVKPITELKS